MTANGQIPVKIVKDYYACPERRMDFQVSGLFNLQRALDRDAKENDATDYIVFDEGGMFSVWRN